MRLLNVFKAVFVGSVALQLCGCLESTQIDCQIVGHSMATAYKSEHSVATCDQCGFGFACDVVGEKRARHLCVVCGNCGSEIDDWPAGRPADQVKLNPGRTIRRWDVVAFQRGDRTLVKRVIGLPEETIDFAEGNLLVDGVVVAKPPRLWNELSAHVYDSKPSTTKPNLMPVLERLVPRVKEAWGVSGTSINHRPKPPSITDVDEDQFDFLDYQHVRCYKNSDDPSRPASIDDAYTFNQTIRRTPHPIYELDVRVKFTFQQEGSVQIQRTVPEGLIRATVELRQDQTLALHLTARGHAGSESVASKEIKLEGKSVELRLVNYDDTIQFFVDGVQHLDFTQLELFKNQPHCDVQGSKSAVRIGVSRADVVAVDRVSIFRDWYLYQESPKPMVALPLNTGQQGYYVVGDNLPVSQDSRHFGCVRDIIGVVNPFDDK